jgi:hypothetical protein
MTLAQGNFFSRIRHQNCDAVYGAPQGSSKVFYAGESLAANMADFLRNPRAMT